jgi:hypothetical protein
VPFEFVTGYGAESIDGRFAHVPILQKPIERQVLQHLFIAPGNGSLRLARSDAGPPESLYPPAAAAARGTASGPPDFGCAAPLGAHSGLRGAP